jgi:chemotaxis protein methyltransferase CheR
LSGSARQLAISRLRTLAGATSGFSLDQIDDNSLLFKLDSGIARCGGLQRYVDRVTSDDGERQTFIEALCTHETRFFRHPAHFEYLAKEYLPAVADQITMGKRPPRLRAWSVACSSGEEPVSIAIAAVEALHVDTEVSVLGTDVSRPVLERARALRWPVSHVQHVPQELLVRHFLKGVGSEDGFIRPVPRIRSKVSFAELNLIAPPPRAALAADLIFCRNVLIYFSAETRARVANWLIGQLNPGGILVTGPSEGFTHLTRNIRTLAPHIYQRNEG